MHHFSYISQSYQTKNKLEAAIYEFLKQQDRKIIPLAESPAFKEELIQEINILNLQHPKCKPISAHWWAGHKTTDFHLSLGTTICNFSLYASIN